MQDQYFANFRDSTNVRVNNNRQRVTHFLLQRFWQWAPKLTEWVVMQLFFTPRTYRMNDAERACLARGHPFQIQVHDKTIRAWRWGHGPAVLMIHGWNGRGIQFHRFVNALVRAGYTAIAIDGPAHGASSGRITSYFEFTDTLRAFLARDQEFQIQGIIGHSFGASAAINALTKEKRSANLVCIAPVLRLRELLLNTFERCGIPLSICHSLIGRFEKRFGYHLKMDNPYGLLADLTSQVLIVHDDRDRIASFDEAAKQVRNHTHIDLYATSGFGHRRLLVDAGVVRRALDHIGQSKAGSSQTIIA